MARRTYNLIAFPHTRNPSQQDDRPEKEADQARSAADGIKAHRSTGCGMQTQRAHLVAICTQTVQMAAKDSGVQTEPLSMAEHGAQAVQDTAECGVQANDELALRMGTLFGC